MHAYMQDVAGAYWASTDGLTVAGTYNFSCLVGRDALASSAGSAAPQLTIVAGPVAPGNTRCCLLRGSLLWGAPLRRTCTCEQDAACICSLLSHARLGAACMLVTGLPCRRTQACA